MRKLRLGLLALLCILLIPVSAAGQTTKGTLRGSVINGTADGGSVANLEVVLFAFQGSTESESLTTVTDSQGQFQFEGLETGSDWGYLVRVTYQDVVYSSDVLAFQQDQSELDAEIAVYETTTSAEGIQIGRAHLLVSLTESGLEVTELYVFVNVTDRTYVGAETIDGHPWTSRFLLPRASHDLSLSDGSLGGRFLSTEGGFVDTEPQWPGSTQVLFAYALDCPSGLCNLERQLDHSISDLNLLIPDAGVTIDSKQFVFQGKMDAQEQSYLNYAASGLAAGTKLDLHIRLGNGTSLGSTSSPSRSGTQALPWIILGTVLVGLALIYPFWRRRIESAARKKQ